MSPFEISKTEVVINSMVCMSSVWQDLSALQRSYLEPGSSGRLSDAAKLPSLASLPASAHGDAGVETWQGKESGEDARKAVWMRWTLSEVRFYVCI
jgi:hypothetical protein